MLLRTDSYQFFLTFIKLIDERSTFCYYRVETIFYLVVFEIILNAFYNIDFDECRR